MNSLVRKLWNSKINTQKLIISQEYTLLLADLSGGDLFFIWLSKLPWLNSGLSINIKQLSADRVILLPNYFPLKTDKEIFFLKTDSVDKKAESNQRPNPDMWIMMEKSC